VSKGSGKGMHVLCIIIYAKERRKKLVVAKFFKYSISKSKVAQRSC